MKNLSLGSLTVCLLVILLYAPVVVGAEGESSAAPAVKNVVKIVPAPQGEAVSGPWSLKDMLKILFFVKIRG